MNVVGRVERRKLAVKAKKKWEFDHRTVSKGERRKAAKETKSGSEEVNLVMDGSESNYLTALPLTGADQHPVEGGGGDKAGVGECADAGEVIGTVADQHSVERDGGGDEAEGGKFSDAGEVIGTVADQHPGEVVGMKQGEGNVLMLVKLLGQWLINIQWSVMVVVMMMKQGEVWRDAGQSWVSRVWWMWWI